MVINNKLRDVQLIAIKKQIDPHFIFNALNGISSMNLKGDQEKADEYLHRFSDMIREVLDSSGENIVALSTEIKLIEKYLLLEQFRFGSDFEYFIDIPANCVDVQMPSMSVHAFVENAIKHGLAAKKGEKKLHVRAKLEKGIVMIEIEDNGVGFNPDKKSSYSTGRGYEIVRQMFFTYHQLTGKKINYARDGNLNEGVLISIFIET